jgi:hypothetical protein
MRFLMAIVGVFCSSTHAFFAPVAERGMVAPGFAARRQLSPALPAGRAMLEFVDHLAGELNRLTPSGIAVYRPARLQRPYGETSRRAALETLVTMAGAHTGLEAEIMPDARIRSRLGLPRSGTLGTYVIQIFPSPANPYWTAGRGLAALTAAAALDEA